MVHGEAALGDGRERGGGEADDEEGNAQAAGSFDAQAFTQIVGDNFFLVYVRFAVQVDALPEKCLASWSEGCMCHEALQLGRKLRRGEKGGMSDYTRRKMLKRHSGQGVIACPMAGKRAPEMAAGWVTELLDEAWRLLEVTILEWSEVGSFSE